MAKKPIRSIEALLTFTLYTQGTPNEKVLSLTTLMAGAMMVFNAAAADAPKELNTGILGGQNATQQIGDNQCVKQFPDKELNVDTKLRNSSDYSGVIRACWAARLTGAEHVAVVVRFGLHQGSESGGHRRHRGRRRRPVARLPLGSGGEGR